MTAVTFPDRVAARMTTLQPLRALLSVLAAPFFLLGLTVGLLLAAVLWCWAAVVEGFVDGAGRRGDRP